MLEVIGVTHRFANAQRDAAPLLAGVGLQIRSGELVGLVGRSGCGKSTLARCLVGLTAPHAGQLAVNGEALPWPLRKRTRAQRHKVQMVFQDPGASLNPRHTIGFALAEALLLRDAAMSKEAVVAATTALLRSVELTGSVAERLPHTFSGGERQRIAIARALAVQPQFLVADEVTSSLDTVAQRDVLELLQGMARTAGLGVLLISHDPNVVAHCCTRHYRLEAGALKEMAAGASGDL